MNEKPPVHIATQESKILYHLNKNKDIVSIALSELIDETVNVTNSAMKRTVKKGYAVVNDSTTKPFRYNITEMGYKKLKETLDSGYPDAFSVDVMIAGLKKSKILTAVEIYELMFHPKQRNSIKLRNVKSQIHHSSRRGLVFAAGRTGDTGREVLYGLTPNYKDVIKQIALDKANKMLTIADRNAKKNDCIPLPAYDVSYYDQSLVSQFMRITDPRTI